MQARFRQHLGLLGRMLRPTGTRTFSVGVWHRRSIQKLILTFQWISGQSYPRSVSGFSRSYGERVSAGCRIFSVFESACQPLQFAQFARKLLSGSKNLILVEEQVFRYVLNHQSCPDVHAYALSQFLERKREASNLPSAF